MQWLQRVLYGRYGVDQLSIGLLVFYLILTLVGQLVRWPIMVVLALIPMALCWFRIFSRNIAKRQQENNQFLKLWRPVGDWFQLQRKRIRDRKTHRYFHCPNCKRNLRVPKGKGKICITCPVCKMEFIKKT